MDLEYYSRIMAAAFAVICNRAGAVAKKKGWSGEIFHITAGG
jgi:hypothetical protein